MFSIEQKQHIAREIEKLLLSLNHPEMPKVNPMFTLHVDGKEDWSWADIKPNWTYNEQPAPTNKFNEQMAAETPEGQKQLVNTMNDLVEQEKKQHQPLPQPLPQRGHDAGRSPL